MKKLAVLVALAATCVLAPAAANAAIPSALGITCDVQPAGENDGQRWCGSGAFKQSPADVRSTVQSFDGVPIDVNVAFPSTGGDGPYPLVMMFHGYGGGKENFPGMQRWLDKGYAVLAQTNRGFHESCGTPLAKAADPDCATKGFVRLDDTRYEVHDAQLFAGMLVDEGLVQPTKIAATGGSYGGGMSMALAALKNRVMMPDGSLVPWKSPGDVAMSLAVAIPNIPWTDLAYSLAPNGSNYDYVKDSAYHGRFGVMKQSYVNGLYLSGITSGEGYYTAPGVEPSADLTGWKDFMDLGEPYDGKAEADSLINEIHTNHSSYYIDHSVAPAPMMISSGFTDDLFPANEATRFYNRTRAQYPSSPLALFFGDFGHMRAQNKSDVRSALTTQENAWVDHYLSGAGSQPASNVTSWSLTCPNEAASGGPYVASDWASSSPGEIRLVDDGASQTVAPDGGTRAVAASFNPAPAGTACTSVAGAKEPGTANYELAPAPAGGFTMLGSPTVVAKITQAGVNSQIAARLVDVSADGTSKTLVDRALWRPASSGFQVFQLTPNAWKVEQGHVLRLELLPSDNGGDATALLSNYGRPSNDQQPATIEKVDLRIPTLDAPGAAGGLVKAPVEKVLPDVPGVELANGYEDIGSETLTQYAAGGKKLGLVKVKGPFRIKGVNMRARVLCPAKFDKCRTSKVIVKGAKNLKKGQGRNIFVSKKGNIRISPGKGRTIKFGVVKKARTLFRDHKVGPKGGPKKMVKGKKSLRVQVAIYSGKYRAGQKSTIKRIGPVR
jgi:dienelactone hydrolase